MQWALHFPTSSSLAHDLPYLLTRPTSPFLFMSPCSNLNREYRGQAECEKLHWGVLARHGLLHSVQVAKEVPLGGWARSPGTSRLVSSSPETSFSQPACLSPSQNVMLTTMGLASALATLATNGTPRFAPFTQPAGATGQKEIPVYVAASTGLSLVTASCCHLVRRFMNLNTSIPK